MGKDKIRYFQEKMLVWFELNGRNFYWRKKNISDYEIIISELFLQRTKAETINNFLPSFFKKYPNWKSLSNTTELEIQETLKPIGLYKQRGARLYKLAKELKKLDYNFPQERESIEKLPLIGQYMANAFELYIKKVPKPLLDVNMARIIERFFGERKLADIRYDPYLQELAYRIVQVKNSIYLNWAILDYASIICKKNKPKCDSCIISTRCNFYNLIKL